LTVSGPSNGGTPTAIDMGGNVVHDVATPIVGTDAANKAYVDKGVNKAFEGTALALAIEQPLFMPGQSFAIRAGWGDYEGQNAFGVSAAGVLARNFMGYGSTVVVDAGVGVGGNYNGVAGKAGVTFGFGGTAPLK
jgi:trimeric autotransporter adhesin